MDSIQFKIIKKAVAPLIKPFFSSLIEEKNKVELKEGEAEPVFMIYESNNEIMICAPILNQENKITRYVPLKDKEALSINELLGKM